VTVAGKTGRVSNVEVTAEDFKYSFERMMRLPNAPGTYFYTGVVGADAFQKGKAAHVAGYKALDKYTIQIDLEQPDLAFLNALTVDFCDPIPKEWVAKWGSKVGRHPLGTGPFVFDRWTPGQEIVLSRNPNYRDAAHVWLDGIKFELTDSAQSAFLKLQLGDVDVLGNNVPPANVVSVSNSPEWKPYVYREPVIGTIYLFLNVQFPPLDNVTVRQAISWAIDRDKLAKLLTGDEFYNYYFGELGASYMWMFQYMPIGREFTTDLMLSPTERFELYKKWRSLIHNEHWFVADFWNSAEMCEGCISCGKSYFYIDWNANIMPCVFIPYYKDNLRQVYAEGRTVADAMFSDFFVKGREWQENYLKTEAPGANLLRPCLIRDHHKEFMEIARACNVIPEDEAAAEAFNDEGYHQKMYEFDAELEAIADPYWKDVLSK